MVKGYFTKDDTVHPISEKKKRLVGSSEESHHKSGDDLESFAEEQKAEFENGNKEIRISEHNYQFEMNKDGLDLGLGNMSDSGWYWTGTQNDIVDWLVRMHSTIERDDLWSDFVKKFEEQGGSFKDLKKYAEKSIRENDDGFYTLSGDNIRWKFGEDGFVEGEIENEIDFRLKDADDDYNITSEEAEKLKDEVWNHVKEPTYDEYLKENKNWYATRLEAIFGRSESFDDFEEGLEKFKDAILDQRFEETQQIARDAVEEAIKKIRSE